MLRGSQGDRAIKTTTVHLHTPHIGLASLLKLAGIVGTGGEGKMLILDGLVQLNGQVETRRGAKVRPGDVVKLLTNPPIQIDVSDEPAETGAWA